LSRALGADGRPYHAAGASDAQELAATISAALEHLRALEKQDVGVTEGASQILFRLALDANIFAGAVKQRALRVLWTNICESCGDQQAASSFKLHAETATRMLHRFDPWVNQLRTTASTLSAAIGGADYLSTHGYDEVSVLPSALASRVARNNQLMLQQESHLHAVADPMGGSGFAESYTDALVEKAWAELQQLEQEGGLIASLTAGKFQARIAETKEERLKAIAKRKQPLTGVSEFPNLDDTPPAGDSVDWDSELKAALDRADTQFLPLPDGAPAFCDPLEPSVLGEQFEALRLAALGNGSAPTCALITLGTQAQYTPRATFIDNLLAAGGLHSARAGELSNIEAAVSAWKQSGSSVAILCGADANYEEQAVDITTALKAAGCKHIYCAGKGGALEDSLNAAGIKGYIAMGMDVVSLLQQLHADLEVRS